MLTVITEGSASSMSFVLPVALGVAVGACLVVVAIVVVVCCCRRRTSEKHLKSLRAFSSLNHCVVSFIKILSFCTVCLNDVIRDMIKSVINSSSRC